MIQRGSLTLLLLLIIIPVFLLSARSSRAADEGDGRNGGAVKLLTTISATECPTCANDRIVVFDISWVDQATERYYLADRSNNAVDVIDAKNSMYLKQINKGAFKGFTGSNNTSGPNGVVVSGHWLFVTDAPSTVWSFDLRTDAVVDVIQTDPVSLNRADELAYDPEDGIILAVNNADTPPFATLIKVNKATGQFIRPTTRITFSDATNGAEQPAWDPQTHRFYLSIPEVNCPAADSRCGGAFPNGAVKRINPFTATVEQTFPADFCQPAGLALGPHGDLLLGCSVIFNDNPAGAQAWTGLTDPFTAAPTQMIMDAKTGAIDKVVAGVGGSDEVWFNPGDGRYYTASRENPGAVLIAGNTPASPVLGVIDAESQTLTQVVPTFDTPASSSAPRGSAHSVAVDSHNNHAFVPLPANNVFPNCLHGCFAVFGAPRGDHDEN